MQSKSKLLVPVILSILLVPVITSKVNAADSPCKGLDQAACTAKEVLPGQKACIWVNGYKTVAGTDRKAYCRASNKKAQQAKN